MRLRLKPCRVPTGDVIGAWWPRSIELVAELSALVGRLESRWGRVDRVVYDRNLWAPGPPEMTVGGHTVHLHGSWDRAVNIVSLCGPVFGTRALLVVPPCTDPVRAYSAVVTAADPDDCSTTDELLGIGAHEAEERHLAQIAQQRWESEGGALKTPSRGLGHHP
ncbi:hypothetical protein H7J88_02320 [Mycolicibacterium flavescens]|uniref:Uncharacterized protein n=1 Tax=Mycolicibacterium flavescens TaxID=1776 RepID=A0A1E3REF4_MYCFV|nr:DUF5994 family protein [Mycolicibacterium flavescens]MCV7278480.1 hypothetical protein [Mycolicibacterium flavescens]ODQ87832.1 hypothetical protein BHQ18_22015 [Mycolicibacterium flavescens]